MARESSFLGGLFRRVLIPPVTVLLIRYNDTLVNPYHKQKKKHSWAMKLETPLALSFNINSQLIVNLNQIPLVFMYFYECRSCYVGL